MRIVLALTGASGIIYGVRLAEHLSNAGVELYSIVTDSALKVANSEYLSSDKLIGVLRKYSKAVYSENDFMSPLASSSFIVDAVVVAPCSLKTLSDIANSRQDTLVSRVAGIALRTRKKLILLIRETPLSTIDIMNMLKASISGAVIMPASPAFYGHPESLVDLIDFICGKIMDLLGIENDIYVRWGDKLTRGNSLCDQLFGSADP